MYSGTPGGNYRPEEDRAMIAEHLSVERSHALSNTEAATIAKFAALLTDQFGARAKEVYESTGMQLILDWHLISRYGQDLAPVVSGMEFVKDLQGLLAKIEAEVPGGFVREGWVRRYQSATRGMQKEFEKSSRKSTGAAQENKRKYQRLRDSGNQVRHVGGTVIGVHERILAASKVI